MSVFKDKNIKPMLLHEENKPFDDEDYLFEMKFDGIRALIYVSPKEIIIKNRKGFVVNDTFPELLEIQKNIKKECIFDGEIVLMQDDKPSFSKLQERALLKNNKKIEYFRDNFPVTFVCFDILYENKDLMNLPLIRRKEILSKYDDNNLFVKSRVVDTKGKELFKFIQKNDLEGIVAKLKTSEYIPGVRTKEWIKIKNVHMEDFYICGYKDGEDVISVLLGEKVGKKYTFVSKVVVGKKIKDYELIKSCSECKNYLGVDFKEYKFIKPKYKCTIEFLERTNSNHLRHPVFRGIRTDL